MISKWSYFIWLIQEANGGLIWAWPVTLLFLFGLPAGVALGYPKRSQLRILVVHLAVLSMPLATLALGSWFACENCSPSSIGLGKRHTTAIAIANGLTVLQVLVAVWLVWMSRGWRTLAAFIQGGFFWWALWAGFMAGMSMTGDWL